MRTTKLKVLHITGEYPPYVLGGLGTYVHEITNQLDNLGVNIEVLVLNGNIKNYNKTSFYKKNGVKVINKHFDTNDFKQLGNKVINSKEIIKKFSLEKIIKSKPDVIHVHDWYGALWGTIIKNETGAKLIFTSHLPIRAGFTYTGHSISMKMKMELEALAIRFADLILSPSESVMNTLIGEYNAAENKIKVLPNGINTDNFSTFLKKGKQSLSKRKTILSVSRLSEQKGLFYLLDVINSVRKKYPNVLCKILGDGENKDSLINETKKLGLESNIEFVGYIDHTELPSYYQSADLFLCTSIYEPFGLVVLESLASGTPVISFAVGGIKEIIEDGQDGILISPTDSEQMSQAVINLFNDKEKVAKLKETGLEKANIYKWHKIALKLMNIYQEIYDK